ncbi:phage tail length tape measure family protein [Tabrizicola sp.]|uniref:phage tail length tape measure family protein n=1 Tax=Tabrizicola sp. TaxID=2005166 RepID=UPI0027342F3C|nr:phage tail length tape measure family protein [Tabrizicola sp.]MDP3196144.1 phage tail length tape measure family protein [Tabrizicola sp.]
MSETHTLHLKIDPTQAESGAKRFTGAIAAVAKAVESLERDTTGAFSKLNKVDVSRLTDAEAAIRRTGKAAGGLSTALTGAGSASDRAAADIRRLALASTNALRVSTDQASRLRDRLLSVGDTAGLAKLESGLARLRSNLIAATSGLDVREARAGYADLASELNRTAREAERLNAIAIAEERALEQAARAASTHADALQRLRAAHDPIYASSQRYAVALSEIDSLVAANVVSEAQAVAMRDRAAQSYLTAGNAADMYATQSRHAAMASQQVGFQLNDIGVMLAGGMSPLSIAVGQGTQLAQTFQSLGKGSSILSTLGGGFMALLSPVSLITIGVIGFGSAIVQWMMSGSDETRSFSDALGDANSSISAVRQATDLLAGASLGSLAEGYGRVNAELQTHLEKLQEIARIEATQKTSAALSAVGDEFLGGFLTTDVDDMRIAFSTTNDEARVLLGMLEQIKAARTFEEQLAAVTAMRTEVESVTGGIKKAEGGALAFLTQLLKAEDAGMRLNAATDGTAGAANNASGAASGLAYTIGTAADEAARLLGNLNSVPGALAAMGRSVQGQIESIRAQNSALNYELSEGLSSAAANRRVQLDTMVTTAGTRGQKLNFDQIASEYQAIAELDAASKETDRLRSEISEKNKPAKSAGGGGGRAGGLSEEAKAADELNKSLTERLTGLEQERVTLQALAQNQFESAEAAELFAQAMVAGGGAVDAQTMAMIKQIDVAAKLNEELKKAARDPVKEWMDSVPNWLEAGKQIEMGAIDSLKSTLSDFIKTGKFDLESLGESILGLVADIVADKAVKELMTLMGRGEQSPTGGFGGMLAGLFSSTGDTEIPGFGGDAAAIATGGQQAGTTIATSMTTAGQQVAMDIQAAMTSGGQQAGGAVQSGLAAGSTNVRTAAQTGLATGSNNIRIASSTGGAELGRGVVQGAQQGAPILSAAVAGGAGGGGGGGMFSWESLLGMAIGAFSEGGMSNSPVGFANVSPSAFRNAPHFSQGTANTSGIPAMLHDNEAVIPLSKGRKIGVELNGDSAGGGQTVVQNMSFNFPNSDADSFKRSKSQVAADMASAGQRAAQKNR